MTSSARSFPRDEAAATSPLRNAFASSSTKPLHSPFLARRIRTANDSSYHHPATSQAGRQPDAISTSSSTLVNADTASDYRPWEVRSASGSSVDSLAELRGGRGASFSALDDIGTLPSIHISPLPRRSASRANTTAAQASSRASNDSSLTRSRPVRQLCPVDCRCSDQEIDLGLCRRVVASSSSGSESGSLSVGVHPMRPRVADRSATSPSQLANYDTDAANGIQSADQSQHSWHTISEPRSQARDFHKDPILVPRSARSRGSGAGGRRSSTASYQRSFDQLQKGLDTLDSNESDADSDADQAQAAQRRAESMARWTARRMSLSQSTHERRSSSAKLESPPHPPPLPKSSPLHSAPRSLASDASIPHRTPDANRAYTDVSTPLKATPGRKSIAAVFESMQKEREARAAEQHRQWQEKQARRERERAARAFGMPARRRTSAASSLMDIPGSAGVAPDTPVSQGQTTAFHSMVSRASPARSEAASVVSASSPLLSSPGSPKVDDGAAGDVQPRHLGEEAAGRIPETLAEADEVGEDADEIHARSQATSKNEGQQEDQPAAPLPSTPQTKHASGFGFASQPMALDLSPVRSVSDFSSPASSPRKNAHRRQNTNTISVAARLPSASVAAARQRFDSALATPAPQPTQQTAESPRTPYAQTPTGGILSSAKKGLPQLSAARRGHSVRFSPRPDYRSDSGSWDDSGTQSVHASEGDEARDAAVSRLLLPAKQITIPDILTASMAASDAAAGTDEEEEEDKRLDRPEGSAGVQQQASPVNVDPSQPHTPASPSAAASVSQSVRFPGAYAATPVKPYSRHVIRPSPNVSRILPHVIPPATTTTPPPVRQFGLFPTPASDAHIPRESTPPPTLSAMLPPEDPRNSPRSPRPVDLGRDQFARFDAGSSGSEGSSPAASMVEPTNGRRDDAVSATIGRILQTVEAAHGAKVRRMQLGERLNGVSERVGRMEGVEKPVRFGAGSRGGLAWEDEVAREDQADRERMDELKQQVMHALAVLADRIVALQTQNNTTIASTELAADTSSSLIKVHKRTRRGLSRRTTLLLVVLQCALMAWLMGLAERKAERMRMYHPSPHLAVLDSSNVQWNALATDPHLQPLLHIPLLHQLYHRYPPLPSPHAQSFDYHNSSPWHVYKTYIRLNGGATLLLQLSVYAVSQLIAYATLLIVAPLQVLWIVVGAHDAPAARTRFPPAL
ncbi:conserved hypothetical protein [Sporisorium reilianum SRZ2]|uniref:Uncharacterized protein n=1 Tax=Sporisorium reilianum (strain SRZ2) TaxID=999809 RepID=E6ZL89_SPORE|nr:conserved hypothetical protein [Sporisorium reilianum SRZ2]